MNAISVIVPTLNESDNIPMLIKRISAGFEKTNIKYEIVFIDDNSSDGTQSVIESFAIGYPVRLLTKQGPRGKAFSLLEGFKAAHYDTLCMIDADLQYPPEAIIPMYQLMQSTDTDIVLTNRQDHGTGAVRKITSAGFNFVFTKMMFGFDYDSQSGLKLFKKEVINNISLDPTPWSFDLEFIVRSLEQNYKIVSYDITFAERYAGVAKIQVGKVAYELAKASVKLRLNSSPSKVKNAYKTNRDLAKQAVLVGSVAVSVITAAILSQPFRIHALNEPVPFNVPVVTLPTTIDPILPPTEPAPAPMPAPVPAPAPEPTPPVVAPTPAPPIAAAPIRVESIRPSQSPTLAVSPQPPQPKPRSSVRPTTTAFASNSAAPQQLDQPQVLAVTSSQDIDKSGEATFPDSGLTTGDFSYTKDKQSAAAGYIKPLLIAAVIIALISMGTYLVLKKGWNTVTFNSLGNAKG